MRTAVAVLVTIGIAVAAAAQNPPRTTPLNRTVIVVPNVNGSTAVECEQGLAPQPQPRLTQEERTAVPAPPAAIPAPPSRDLRGTLEAAVRAAHNNDRETFRANVARAHEIVATYPAGGEKGAASDTLSVLDDINTLWDFEFSSPTGAFFDGSSDIHRMLSKYPGYEEAVRRQVITDQTGTRFYPSAESRAFLAGEAAARLERLVGHRITTTQPVAPRVAHRVEQPKPQHVTPRAKAKPVQGKKAPAKVHHRMKKASVTPPHGAATAIAKNAEATAPKPARAAPPVVKPKAPASTSSAAAAPRTETTVPRLAPPPTRTTATAATETQPPPALATRATETTATETAAPAKIATETTASSSTQPVSQQQQQQPAAAPSHGNLILPIILIIAGVGLLVLFSRSSAS